MIKQVKSWVVQCDECGDFYGNSEIDFHFTTKKQAKNFFITDYPDWYVTRNKILCNECIEKNNKKGE